jgi:hypothetical protein
MGASWLRFDGKDSCRQASSDRRTVAATRVQRRSPVMSHRLTLAIAALTVLATTVGASAAEAQLGAKECGVVRYRAFKIRTLK